MVTTATGSRRGAPPVRHVSSVPSSPQRSWRTGASTSVGVAAAAAPADTREVVAEEHTRLRIPPHSIAALASAHLRIHGKNVQKDVTPIVAGRVVNGGVDLPVDAGTLQMKRDPAPNSRKYLVVRYYPVRSPAPTYATHSPRGGPSAATSFGSTTPRGGFRLPGPQAVKSPPSRPAGAGNSRPSSPRASPGRRPLHVVTDFASLDSQLPTTSPRGGGYVKSPARRPAPDGSYASFASLPAAAAGVPVPHVKSPVTRPRASPAATNVGVPHVKSPAGGGRPSSMPVSVPHVKSPSQRVGRYPPAPASAFTGIPEVLSVSSQQELGGRLPSVKSPVRRPTASPRVAPAHPPPVQIAHVKSPSRPAVHVPAVKSPVHHPQPGSPGLHPALDDSFSSFTLAPRSGARTSGTGSRTQPGSAGPGVAVAHVKSPAREPVPHAHHARGSPSRRPARGPPTDYVGGGSSRASYPGGGGGYSASAPASAPLPTVKSPVLRGMGSPRGSLTGSVLAVAPRPRAPAVPHIKSPVHRPVGGGGQHPHTASATEIQAMLASRPRKTPPPPPPRTPRAGAGLQNRPPSLMALPRPAVATAPPGRPAPPPASPSMKSLGSLPVKSCPSPPASPGRRRPPRSPRARVHSVPAQPQATKSAPAPGTTPRGTQRAGASHAALMRRALAEAAVEASPPGTPTGPATPRADPVQEMLRMAAGDGDGDGNGDAAAAAAMPREGDGVHAHAQAAPAPTRGDSTAWPAYRRQSGDGNPFPAVADDYPYPPLVAVTGGGAAQARGGSETEVDGGPRDVIARRADGDDGQPVVSCAQLESRAAALLPAGRVPDPNVETLSVPQHSRLVLANGTIAELLSAKFCYERLGSREAVETDVFDVVLARMVDGGLDLIVDPEELDLPADTAPGRNFHLRVEYTPHPPSAVVYEVPEGCDCYLPEGRIGTLLEADLRVPHHDEVGHGFGVDVLSALSARVVHRGVPVFRVTLAALDVDFDPFPTYRKLLRVMYVPYVEPGGMLIPGQPPKGRTARVALADGRRGPLPHKQLPPQLQQPQPQPQQQLKLHHPPRRPPPSRTDDADAALEFAELLLSGQPARHGGNAW